MQQATTVIINLIAVLAIYSWMAFALARLHWYGRGVGMVVAVIFVAGSVWLAPAFFWSGLGKTVPQTYTLWFGNWIVSGFALILLSAKTSRIPREFADSARVDGCNSWGICWNVVIPLLLRDLGLLALLVLLATAPHFLVNRNIPLRDDIAALIPGAATTSTAGIATLTTASLLMTLPLLVIFFISGRGLRSGVDGRSRQRV